MGGFAIVRVAAEKRAADPPWA